MNELKTGRGIFGRYCKDVLSGKIPACGYVKKAVKRAMKDFARIKEPSFDYDFDWAICEKFFNFTKTIPLPDKDAALALLPWQVFVHFNLLGWVYKKDREKRRFRSGMIQVPRKNGKTTGLMYPLLLWNFITEKAAECYFFEKDEPQARSMYKELQNILSRHELLKSRVESNIFSIYSGNKKIAYFTSETVGIDGYRPSMAIIDEYWCFPPTSKALQAMRMGGRGRDSSLALIITTAGTDIDSPCYDETLKLQKILNGVFDQPDYFGIIYGIDDDTQWNSREAYIMANPSLKDKDGTGIIDPKLLEADLQDAMNQPSRKPEYMAKTLDVWTIATTSWIGIDKFKPPEKVDLSAFDKSPCYGALDLSSVNDWTAYTLCFPAQGSDFYFKHRFYIPYNTVQERFKKENINILAWIDAGLVTVCNNDTIDYSYIFNDIKKDLETFDIKEIAYDGWRASELVKQIEDEMSQITTFAYPQSLKQMSGPTKNLEKLILDKNIATDCQEIIRWMLGNVQIKIDVNGNYKPLKDYRASTNRIDGIITMIMSLDRAMVNKEADYSGKYTFEDILAVF